MIRFSVSLSSACSSSSSPSPGPCGTRTAPFSTTKLLSRTSGSMPTVFRPKANSAAPKVFFARTLAQKWAEAAASNCEATARPPQLSWMPLASAMAAILRAGDRPPVL